MFTYTTIWLAHLGLLVVCRKMVVHKFVVRWIETYKEKGVRLSYALNHVFDNAELGLYIKQQEGDYTETIWKVIRIS